MNRARVINILSGFAFLFLASMSAAVFFLKHRDYYAYGPLVLGVMAMFYLLLIGVAFSLIFGRARP